MAYYTVTAGSPLIIYLPQVTSAQYDERIVVLSPGSGGTMSYQASISNVDTIKGGGGVWVDSTLGTVSEDTQQGLSARVNAIKVTATTADGVCEVTL